MLLIEVPWVTESPVVDQMLIIFLNYTYFSPSMCYNIYFSLLGIDVNCLKMILNYCHFQICILFSIYAGTVALLNDLNKNLSHAVAGHTGFFSLILYRRVFASTVIKINTALQQSKPRHYDKICNVFTKIIYSNILKISLISYQENIDFDFFLL